MVITARSGLPSSLTLFSISALVGQAWTQAPQETHSEDRKLSAACPAPIFDPNPRPLTASASVPWTSSQARTQREQTMHLSGANRK